MIFIICFSIAAVILAITAIRFFRNTENKLLTTGAGVFLALFALFFPSESCASIADTINTIIISIVRSIKVFGLNEDIKKHNLNAVIVFYNFENTTFRTRNDIICFIGMNVDVTEENKKLEHWRWNTYMRTEGFRYSENQNDIAKTHPCLVPYDKLDETTKCKIHSRNCTFLFVLILY